MKTADRRRQINWHMDNMRRELLWAAQHMPDEWDDREVRQYVADRFKAATDWGDGCGKRNIAYKKEMRENKNLRKIFHEGT